MLLLRVCVGHAAPPRGKRRQWAAPLALRPAGTRAICCRRRLCCRKAPRTRAAHRALQVVGVLHQGVSQLGGRLLRRPRHGLPLAAPLPHPRPLRARRACCAMLGGQLLTRGVCCLCRQCYRLRLQSCRHRLRLQPLLLRQLLPVGGASRLLRPALPLCCCCWSQEVHLRPVAAAAGRRRLERACQRNRAQSAGLARRPPASPLRQAHPNMPSRLPLPQNGQAPCSKQPAKDFRSRATAPSATPAPPTPLPSGAPSSQPHPATSSTPFSLHAPQPTHTFSLLPSPFHQPSWNPLSLLLQPSFQP